MKEQRLAETIAILRKKRGATQEEMGNALGVTPQAISKWENGTCLPDTQTLPLIADFFGVSVDYLFYGSENVYETFYPVVEKKVASHAPMSAGSYEEALKLFAAAHHGISHGNLHQEEMLYDKPAHISSEGGVSLLSGKGYGALVTRRFFEGICHETVQVALSVLQALADEKRLRVVLAILSLSGVNFSELHDMTGLPDDELEAVLRSLMDAQIVREKLPKHRVKGKTYEINEFYHTCLCILLATLEMQRLSFRGISCCMGYGDYPIDLNA